MHHASSLARKASRGGGELLVLSAAALNRACCSVMYSFLYFGLGGGVTALATLSAAEKPVETGTGICGLERRFLMILVDSSSGMLGPSLPS